MKLYVPIIVTLQVLVVGCLVVYIPERLVPDIIRMCVITLFFVWGGWLLTSGKLDRWL